MSVGFVLKSSINYKYVTINNFDDINLRTTAVLATLDCDNDGKDNDSDDENESLATLNDKRRHSY